MSLTFVPTPLGNLRDITLRALEVLRACDLLVAEDTRVARKLLAAFELPAKPLWSYREANAPRITAKIVARAASERVAVVCDAGTPGISDPGVPLLAAARTAGVAIEVLPGPCAFVCAAVLSGFSLASLTFAGFVPRRAGERRAALLRALERATTTAFYESPQRIVATLEALGEIAPLACVFVARELTKKFEQQLLGTPEHVLAQLARPVRGELVLVLGTEERPSAAPFVPSSVDVMREIDAGLRAGVTPTDLAKALARRKFGPRRALYTAIIARDKATGGADRAKTKTKR